MLREKFRELLQRLIRGWSAAPWGWRFRKLENLLDDPIDDLKHKLHGLRLPFGYRLNISFLLMNRRTTWPIISKDIDDDEKHKRHN